MPYQNEPLHIAQFPPHNSADATVDFQLLLHSSLDLFYERKQHQPVIDQDLGLLHAFDKQFAAYGWLTNTGTKFVIVVDMEGQAGKDATAGAESDAGAAGVAGLPGANRSPQPFSTTAITNSTFIADVKRIGELWRPGVTSFPV
ncbi:hypothetical protein KEM52_002298 [Ascosphaera acerosa]|nr:hypothetical protein KEM52_002298 [Ascosphaera acerosa]